MAIFVPLHKVMFNTTNLPPIESLRNHTFGKTEAHKFCCEQKLAVPKTGQPAERKSRGALKMSSMSVSESPGKKEQSCHAKAANPRHRGAVSMNPFDFLRLQRSLASGLLWEPWACVQGVLA